MSLKTRARAQAIRHLLVDWNWSKPDHQIWGLYRWFGFDTQRVFCSCGLEFTTRPQGSPSVADLLATIETVRKDAHAGR